ncbi:ABC transporter permease [Paenibacillus sp. GCM10027626]|uniref:ABC transporter permease n=1 Tax=Paenibacillus sp. GCM10027626 TaxID=3273411 RepID=UPI00362A21A4
MLNYRSTVITRLLKDKTLYFMLIPFVLWYLVFLYKPMYGLLIAFQDYSPYKGMSGSSWVGFDNFMTFFQSEYFGRTIRNTILISLYNLLFAFPAPIVLALLLNEVRHLFFKKTIQTLTYLPHFISVVVVAGIVTNFLAPSSGIVNLLIEKLGGEKIYFLVNPDYFRTILIATMDIWKEIGFGAIIYIAALAGVNPHLYEAAVMDGAGKWRQLWSITLPSILPTIVIMLILRIGNFMEVGYEAIILLYQPATYETADVISTYVYRAGLQQGRYDIATAVGLFNSLIGLFLVVSANKLSKKLTENGLW